MKKKSLLFIIITLLLFININVDAATCTPEEKNALRQEARNLEIIPVLDSDTDPIHYHTYSVNFSNLSDKFYILDSNDTKFEYSLSHTPETRYGIYAPGTTATFKVYGAIGKTCGFEHLATIRVRFEYYNDYYLSPLCEGIEEFELCQRTYSGKIETETWFEEQVMKYKESLNKKPVEEEKENIIDKIVNFIKENPLIIVGTIIVLVIIVIVIIVKVKKKKKRIKINLDLK